MCLVKVREEADVVVPYRVGPPPRRGSRRVSRTVERRSFEEYQQPSRRSHSRSESRVVVPAQPPPLRVPPPQPTPVFVQPPPPPPPPPPPLAAPVQPPSPRAHYVHVSPKSSVTSQSDRDYYLHEHIERRVRESSPRSSYTDSPQYEHYRYVDPPRQEPRYVRRERSMSRGRVRYDDDPRSSRNSQPYQSRERISVHLGGDGRRRTSDYYR